MSRFLGCCLVVAVGVTSAHASGPGDDDCSCAIWVPGTGNWSNPVRWSGATVPGVGPDLLDIFIDQQAAAPFNRAVDVWSTHGSNSQLYAHGRPMVTEESVVFVDIDVETASVYLGSADELHVLTGRTLHFGNQSGIESEGPTVELVNNGRMVIEGDGDVAAMVVDEDQTLRLSGSGRVELSDPHFARIEGTTGNELLYNDGGTIMGAGRVGNASLSVRNEGLIEASVPFAALTIQTSDAGLQNQGVVRAEPWTRVNIRSTNVFNVDGLLAADEAATIDLSDSTVLGGTISTASDGVVRNVDGPATLTNVTLNGNYEVGLTTLTLRGGMTNNGTVYVVGQETTSARDIEASMIHIVPIEDAFVLAGEGQVILDSAYILSDSGPTPTFVNGVQHTISGNGAVGGDSLRMINKGVIDASDNKPVLLDPADGEPFMNEGTLRATGAGGLYLLDGAFTNNGTVVVEDGSQIVLLPGATLSNSIAGSLIGGTWIVRGRAQPASLTLSAIPDLTINLADVTLDGVLASFPRLDTMSINSGTFTLLHGKVFTTQGPFTNVETLQVGAGSRFETTGKLTLVDTSRLVIEVGNDQSGLVEASTRIALDGVLEIQCTYGGSWPVGQQIELLSANVITGSFDEIIAPGPFDLDVSGGVVTITPLPQAQCAADFDGDDHVGPMDLFALLDAWGMCPAMDDCPWDLVEDGVVDSSDLFELLAQWGACP